MRKYIPLEITKGDRIATTKNSLGEHIEDHTANIELNGETIGTFFTQWYFYYGNQFGMNDYHSRGVEKIQQIPLGKEGDIFLKVTKDVSDGNYKLAMCNKNGKIDNTLPLLDKKYFYTLENSDLKQYENENISFVIKQGRLMKDIEGKDIDVEGKNFFTADLYRFDNQIKPIGELYSNYGKYFDVDSIDFSGLYYHNLSTGGDIFISDKDDIALTLVNSSDGKYPYFLSVIDIEEGKLFGRMGIGHLDKVDDMKSLFDAGSETICENPLNSTAYYKEHFVADSIYA